MSTRARIALAGAVAAFLSLMALNVPAASAATAHPLTMSQVSAQARQTGKAVVVSSLTTSRSTTTANPNGTFTTASSVAGGPPSAGTQVSSEWPAQSYWDQTQPEEVGNNWSGGFDRSFFQFNTSQLAGVTVLSSQLTLDEVYSAACAVPAGHNGTMNLYLAGAISQQTTWTNQPTLASVIGSTNVLGGYDASCPSVTIGFNVTNAVRSTAATAAGSITFGLRAVNEQDLYSWRKFSSTNSVLYTTYAVS